MEQPPSSTRDDLSEYLVRQLDVLQQNINLAGVIRTTTVPNRPIEGKIYYFPVALPPTISEPGYWVFLGGLWQPLSPVEPVGYALPLAANWVQVVNATPAVYSKDYTGLVTVKGTVQYTAGSGLNTTIAILPVGFRPIYQQLFPAVVDAGANKDSAAVEILTTGEIRLALGDASTLLALGIFTFSS